MYLGIDLGTSSVKCVLMDESLSIIATSSSDLALSRPQPLWSEQNPIDWWQATNQAFFKLKEQHPKSTAAIKAIGLSGQMHGVCLLDDKGGVIRPAMLWNDGRAFKECDELLDACPDAVAITGNLIMPGFSAPKLLWLKKHELESFHQIHKVLLPKDYLRYRMSGVFATDCSDASGTAWFDVKSRAWSTSLLAACGLTKRHMPDVFDGLEITTTISRELASHWGIDVNTVIVAGGGDNAASAISVNVTKPGSAFLSLGTSGVYFVADDQYRPNPDNAIHTFCHCLPNLWHEMNVHLNSGSSVIWCASMLDKPIELLVDMASQRGVKNTPLFLPYLSGERTPHNNAMARGVFFGLDDASDNATMMQSVLEGVALSFKQSQETLKASGVSIDNIALVGGGARSEYWAKLIASCLNRPLNIIEGASVGGALGAARLAWMGHTQSQVTDLPAEKVAQIVEPDVTWQAYFDQRLPLFSRLYHNLKDDFISFYQL